ncbi:hypothetical protein CHS0354_033007 [Potamilus streckersoni]|uniref:Uncharacterized protein n=1 Tax=Potamilus streckersoni TaxID=2493646 RepID=A0AAE0RXR8_9BIVA|nr:hypothetical protein CHS0354_033007 [Potamilus streckersoni]
MLLSPVLYIISACFIQFTTTISFFSRHKVPTVAADGNNIFLSHKQNTFPGYSDIFRRNYLTIPTFTRTRLKESDRTSYGRPEVMPFFPRTEDRLTQQSETSDSGGYPYHKHVEQRKDPLIGIVRSQIGKGSSKRHIFFDAMRLQNSKVNLLSHPFLKHKDLSRGVMKLVNTPSFFPRNIYQSRYRSNPNTPNTLNPIDFRMSLLAPSGSSLFSSPLRVPKVNDDFGIPKGIPKDTYDSNIPIKDPFLSDLNKEINDRPEVNIHGNYAKKLNNSLLNVMNKEQETLAEPRSVDIELNANLDILSNDMHEDKSNSFSRDLIADALGKYLDLSANQKHRTAGEVDTKRLEEDLPKLGTTLEFSGKSKLIPESSKISPSPSEDGLMMYADLPSYSTDRIKEEYGGIVDDTIAGNQKGKTQEIVEHNKPSFINILYEFKNDNLRTYDSHHRIPEKEYFAPTRQSDPFHILPESDPFQTLPRKDTDPGFDKNKFVLTVTSFPPNTDFGKPQYKDGKSLDNNDTRDCETIDTKTCSANSECSCLGLYVCTEGKCQTIPPPTQEKEDRNTGSMIWHEPVSFDIK